MAEKLEESQLVVRISGQLEADIQREAKLLGLTKAGWARLLFIREVARLKAERKKA